MISAILLKYTAFPIAPFIKVLVILVPAVILILAGGYWLWTSLRRPPDN